MVITAPRGRVAMVAYTRYSCDARVRRHVDALTSAGYAVDVYALREDDVAAGVEAGSRLRFFLRQSRRLDRRGTLSTLLGYVRFLLACSVQLLRTQRRDGPYALVHVNNMPNFLVLAGLPLRAAGTRVLLDVHDTMVELLRDRLGVGPRHLVTRLSGLEERLSMRAADFVITSEHTKEERLHANGLAPGRSSVVLNLPDAVLFPDRPLPRQPPPRSGAFRLVYHGTLAHRLGVDVGVEAVHLLRERIPGLRFDIIGDGEQRPALIRRIRELGLEDHVVLSDGFVPTPELPALLRGADLAVVPSRDSVGTQLMLPTKLLEYVQLGIPVVAVPTTTIRRYFTGDQVAFVPGGDPHALADCIHDLWMDPRRRWEQARAARRFTACHPGRQAQDAYLDVVEHLVGTGAVRRG